LLGVEEFDAFYAVAAPKLVGQIYALVGSRQEAQDVVQEACLRAWMRWDSISAYENPEAWVRLVAWRLAVSRRRRVISHVRAWQKRTAGEDLYEPGMTPDAIALQDALLKIPLVQREAIVLHHLCGLTVDEVAAQLSVSPNTIKTRLVRGRAALALLLGDDVTSSRIAQSEAPHA
jgi:RNA polymerase sigma-70 factor (ECF subfamily)